MIPDSGCISDTPQTPKKHNVVESIVKDLNKQTHEFKLKHGYTVSELRSKYMPEKPIDLTEVMILIIDSVKGGYKTALYNGNLSEKELTALQLFDYTVVRFTDGTYEISGWSDV